MDVSQTPISMVIAWTWPTAESMSPHWWPNSLFSRNWTSDASLLTITPHQSAQTHPTNMRFGIYDKYKNRFFSRSYVFRTRVIMAVHNLPIHRNSYQNLSSHIPSEFLNSFDNLCKYSTVFSKYNKAHWPLGGKECY